MTLSLCGGTDNQANDSLSTKRSTTKWLLMLINMQLSSALSKARLNLRLRWRPREENVEADQLTNESFEGFPPNLRVQLSFEEIDLRLVEELWETKLQFDIARQESKDSKKLIDGSKKRKFEKSEW